MPIPLGIVASSASSTPAPDPPTSRTPTTAVGTANLAPAAPSGVQASDVLIWCLMISGGGATSSSFATPAGLTLINTGGVPTDLSTTRRLYLFRGTGSQAGTTFVKTGTNGARATCVAVAGATYDTAVTATQATSTTWTVPTVTTAAANSLVLAFCGSGASITWTEATGYTEIKEDTTTVSVHVSEKVYASAGATGAITLAGSANGCVAHVSIGPD